ncbi:MAG: flagellar protein FliS [Clostridiales bacterium]|jgi:flagellin-specific chaperone FliS|nr:flagellar protein FliS [Clostridiales bacterium]MDR2751951.1 flagellar protein FliS [Clostridiales bacterium]
MDKAKLVRLAKSASREELVSITLEAAIGFIQEFEPGKSLEKARQALCCLIDGLDFRHAPANALFRIYICANKKLCLAESRGDKSLAQEVIVCLTQILEIWREISKHPRPGDPGILACGLTYRNGLPEETAIVSNSVEYKA